MIGGDQQRPATAGFLIPGHRSDAAQQAADYSAELASEASSTIRSQLEADGATVIDVDRSAFAAKLKDAAHKQEVEGLWSEGLYDKIQAID